MASFRRQRLDYDLAEAELARSQAALAAGELAAASRWAAAAERRFRRRGNDAWADLAELTRLRARSASPGRRAPIAAEALLLAGRLRGSRAGQRRGHGRADRGPGAGSRPGAPTRRGGGSRSVRRRGPAVPLDVGLLRRLARAELAEREGRPGAALAELRAGLALVQARRGRLGSIDLQTGTAALGADLAAAGLRLALERGSAPLVFAWLERSRAQAFRVRPVRPPADPQAAAILAELRQLSYLIREAELDGSSATRPWSARHAELQPRDQGARLAGQRPGRRGRAGQPRRGERGPGAERADPGGHPGPARPDGRGGGAARSGAPGPARRLRSGRRGGQAAERRSRHAGRTAAARPARGRDQGVDPAPGGHADGRDRRAAARLRSATAASCSCPRAPLAEHSLGHAARACAAARSPCARPRPPGWPPGGRGRPRRTGAGPTAAAAGGAGPGARGPGGHRDRHGPIRAAARCSRNRPP